MNYKMGWNPAPPDPRDYALETYTAPLLPPTKRIQNWPNPWPTLNQGDLGTCGGNGGVQWCNVMPVTPEHGYTEHDALVLYQLATKFDGQEDNPFVPGGGQLGCTERGVAKALKAWGRLGAYAFTTSQNTMLQWCLLKGPLMIGVQWTTGMFQPDGRGYIHPTGSVEGGHFLVIDGVDLKRGHLRLLNSWANEDGTPWGIGGRCYMEFAEFYDNFRQRGRCIAGLELPQPRPDSPGSGVSAG